MVDMPDGTDVTDVTDDARLARELAGRAGDLLLRLRSDPPDGARLRDAADAGAHRLISSLLARHRPGDVLFSEEAPDPRQRLAASRVWIVDPLDGTREYGEPGRTDWAVHVALWADGDLVAGAVALPALGEVYGTDAPPARPGRPGGDPAGAPARVVVSRSRPPAVATAMALDLGLELVPLGSAGAKAAAVWRGEAEAYVHTGGLHEWDAAAPVAVARAAGLHVSRLDGAPLAFNLADPYLPDLLVCIPDLTGTLLSWIARHHDETATR
jgi:3'(2'), 5'-bisphosphate nucleotidase